MSKAYWPSFALKIGLEQTKNLLEESTTSNTDNDNLREHIRQVWSEMGFLRLSSPTNKNYSITNRGRLLFNSNSITRDRARYWLQDRFISAWLPTSMIRQKEQPISKLDIFSEISQNSELVALSQRVLNSYADQDWHGIGSVFSNELFQSSTIVDLGGGIGSLLRELSKHCSNQRLICIDRPEVIRLVSSHSKIEYLSCRYVF